MKRRTTDKKRLVDRKVNQASVMMFPDKIRNAYETYSLLSYGELARDKSRVSPQEALKHALMILLWIGALTTFFVVQRTTPQSTPTANDSTKAMHHEIGDRPHNTL